jgi:hypothetical protein
MQSNARRYLNKMNFCVAISFSAASGGIAQDLPSKHQIQRIETAQARPVVLPEPYSNIVVGKDVVHSFMSHSGEALLSGIASWLATNFDLPTIHDHPHVEFVPQSKMAALRYRGLISDRAPSVAGNPDAPLGGGQNIVAIYDDARRTIYLPEGWTGTSPAEISVLVHEMVHHMQNAAGLKYECPQGREKPAFLAQERWLGLFGRSLVEDFDIDPLTVLVRSACM